MKNNILKKKELRKKQFNIRKQLFTKISKTFDKYLFEELFIKIDFEKIKVVSSFVSINTEIKHKNIKIS